MSIALPMSTPRVRRQPQPPTKIGSIMLSHINLLDLSALDEPIGTPMDLPATILGNPYIAKVRCQKVQAVPGLVTSLEWQQALLQELDGCAKVMRQLGQTSYDSSWDIHDGRQQYLFQLSLVPAPDPSNGNPDDNANANAGNDTNTGNPTSSQDQKPVTPAITPSAPVTPNTPVRTISSPPPRPAQPQRITPRH